MSYLGQQLVNGLTLGGVYALIALGYTLVYGVLQILNFAHGDVYMVGAFIGFFVMVGLGGPLAPSVPVAIMVLIMFLVAMLGTGLLGIVIERFAYRPLRNSTRIAPLISALGVSILLQNAALLIDDGRILARHVLRSDAAIGADARELQHTVIDESEWLTVLSRC